MAVLGHHRGRKPKYTDLEDERLLWINEKREQGYMGLDRRVD